MTYHQPSERLARQFAASSKSTPCPICGRTKDGDCRFRDGLIMCHQGATSGPPAHLQPGDVITVDGQRWALVSRSGGYSGCAAVFRPDRGKGGASHAPRPQEQQGLEDRAGIAISAINAWLDLAKQVSDIPEFLWLLTTDVYSYCNLIDKAYSRGLALTRSLAPLFGRYRALDPYRRKLAEALRDVHYQRQGAIDWRKNNYGIEDGWRYSDFQG